MQPNSDQNDQISTKIIKLRPNLTEFQPKNNQIRPTVHAFRDCYGVLYGFVGGLCEFLWDSMVCNWGFLGTPFEHERQKRWIILAWGVPLPRWGNSTSREGSSTRLSVTLRGHFPRFNPSHRGAFFLNFQNPKGQHMCAHRAKLGGEPKIISPRLQFCTEI